ncbi:helix-turn-helix domain-containing protein, partial [Streptomyces albidoflavus]|uniref:helix-turn-helix domain-containing protein n=1 Tax=Streptomyces albidoflavus TaxID=1886 RepID=UPI00343923A7
DAKLGEGVSPHTLRHTAATWSMQNGTDLAKAASFLGMTVETLERVYWHHHPDYQVDAAENLSRSPARLFPDRYDRKEHEQTRTDESNIVEIIRFS